MGVFANTQDKCGYWHGHFRTFLDFQFVLYTVFTKGVRAANTREPREEREQSSIEPSGVPVIGQNQEGANAPKPRWHLPPTRNLRRTEARETFMCFFMSFWQKTVRIFLETLPIIAMVVLIPSVKNDLLLFGLYAVIIAGSFLVRYEKNEWIIFLFGLVAMTVSEYGFVSTGVETFERSSLFGIMPIWLPLLWAYGFVAMSRSTKILNS